MRHSERNVLGAFFRLKLQYFSFFIADRIENGSEMRYNKLH